MPSNLQPLRFSGAFRQPSDHIETKTRIRSVTASRYTRLIGHEPTRKTKVERSRFSSFAASRLRRRYLPPTTPCFRNPTPVQPTPVRGTFRSPGQRSRQVVQPRKGVWI